MKLGVLPLRCEFDRHLSTAGSMSLELLESWIFVGVLLMVASLSGRLSIGNPLGLVRNTRWTL
ncbi:UNVERIFIED_CONTAM: hypothetical protein NY603_22470, partial [Bacteroidetes bacterium 56_B9]